LNFLYLQILNAQSISGSGSCSSGSGSSGSNSEISTIYITYYSNVDQKSYSSLSVFLNLLEVKLKELQNAAPAESGSGLSIEQEEKLNIIGIPHSLDMRLLLDPAYTIQFLQKGSGDYKDPVLNFTDRVRLQQRDPNGPETDKRGVPIDINYNKSKGALVFKMNTPEIILPQQFQVRFDPLENAISFIKPGSDYDTTYPYYKATLRFGSDSQKVYSENVYQDGSSLYTVIKTLQTEVEELKTKLANLDTTQIIHKSGTESIPVIQTLKEKLTIMREDSNKHYSSNGYIYNQTAFLDFLDEGIKRSYFKAEGQNVFLPAYPSAIGQY
jgi:hypothetical protein